MKESQNNKKEVMKFIGYMNGIYGNSITSTIGKKRTYVIMDINYSTPMEVILSMYSYITEFID